MLAGLVLSFFGAFYFSFTKVMELRRPYSKQQNIFDEIDASPSIALPKTKV